MAEVIPCCVVIAHMSMSGGLLAAWLDSPLGIVPGSTCIWTSLHDDWRPIDGSGYRCPAMALVAQHPLDGAAWQAWRTVHKWRSQRRVIMVLSQIGADG